MPRIPFQVRGLILRSAKEEFLSRGFEGASLRSICKRAGLTTGAFYNHFSRKEDLFDALVAPRIEEFHGLYGKVMSRELEDRICSIINELDSWGCRPQIVTAASPFVARTIKTHFPDIETRASVNMRLTTLQAMKYLAPWFDSYYIGRDVHRNLDTVKSMSDWAHSNGKKVGILANSGCLRNCPWQTYHDNLISHSAQALKVSPAGGFNPHLCWTMYENPDNFPEILKATWIRPEDLYRYEPYVDFVKLATRQHSMLHLVLDAYSSRSFRGNLLDLLEPGFAPAFGRAGVLLDNSAFPSDWAEKTSRCSRECTDCGYCENVFDMIRRKI